MSQETQPEHPDPNEPQDEGGESDAPEGPDPSELDKDPAYEPDEEGLKDLKGG
jgi:hypothetical protein